MRAVFSHGACRFDPCKKRRRRVHHVERARASQHYPSVRVLHAARREKSMQCARFALLFLKGFDARIVCSG